MLFFFFCFSVFRFSFVFFVFQAEDGIRDLYVTGVQTCALPISWTARVAQSERSAVSTLCPTPGTTTRRPCGNCARTARAFAVGVRRSRPPLSARTGTFGYGPLPS